MDLKTIVAVLEADTCTRLPNRAVEVKHGCGADLMSDVLAYSRAGSLLLTGLTHPQVIRTADIAGIAAIVFVRAKQPPEATIALAEEVGIPLFATRYTMYDACGRLYKAGLNGTGFCESYGDAK